MAKAMERVDEISSFHLGRVKVDKVPPNRLAALAVRGWGKAPNLERTPEPKRTALLASVVRHLEASAIDDALELLTLLMQVKLISVAERATDKDCLAAKPRLAKASRTVTAVYRLWSEQLNLVTEHGSDLDAATMWRRWRRRSGRGTRSSPPRRCWTMTEPFPLLSPGRPARRRGPRGALEWPGRVRRRSLDTRVHGHHDPSGRLSLP
ncbi:hypothetical protein ACWC24_34640 [Streptomyces sp. NPDC001443]